MNKKFRLINSSSNATLKLPLNFFEDIIDKMDSVHLKIYLYALQMCENEAIELDGKVIADKLYVSKKDVDDCFAFLEKNNLAMEIKKIKKPSFEDKEFTKQLKFFEQLYNKPLNQNEYIEIYDLIKNQGVPFEVLCAAAQYCLSKDKKNLSYIAKVAIDYKELGLTSFESCENYWNSSSTPVEDERTIRINNLKKMFKMDRDFYQPELEIINKWCFELNKTDAEIEAALNKTILNTGKLSFPYMDKVVCNGAKPIEKEKKRDQKYAEAMEAIRAKRRRGE